jgi:hypothetical protein
MQTSNTDLHPRELYEPPPARKQRVVPPHPAPCPGPDRGAPLPHDNLPGPHELRAKALHPEAPPGGLPVVLGALADLLCGGADGGREEGGAGLGGVLEGRECVFRVRKGRFGVGGINNDRGKDYNDRGKVNDRGMID